MRFAFADPPYLGQGQKRYGYPEWDRAARHVEVLLSGVPIRTGRMSKVAYRGCWIEYDPPPIPIRNFDWRWWHDNYDGLPDSRHGNAASLAAAKAEINELLEDE